jgi:predicted nucleic acid-binding protein
VILVDTSIWIRALAGRTPYREQVDSLLQLGEIAGHELVYGELLIGDSGGRSKFLASYLKIYQAAMVPHSDVVDFVRERKLHGRGLGWIDTHLLASAIVERQQLWTADLSVAAVARELAVSWR